MSRDEKIVIGEGHIYCRHCDVKIGFSGKASEEKVIKQHVKSKFHKKLLPKPTTFQAPFPSSNPDSEQTRPMCSFCEYLNREDSFHFLDESDLLTEEHVNRVCHAPPFKDLATIDNKPFLTRHGGELPELPENLQQTLEQYCVGGEERLPNVDINLRTVEIRSWAHARRELQEANLKKCAFWAAFSASDMEHPRWWTTKDLNPVPGYTQIIVGSGPTDIGLHVDQYGEKKIPVDSYLTLQSGAKKVLMLPPTRTFEEWRERFGWNRVDKCPFPEGDIELIKRVKDDGGFYFTIEPSKDGSVTLFVPRGWFHWLLGLTDWTLVLGGSRF